MTIDYIPGTTNNLVGDPAEGGAFSSGNKFEISSSNNASADAANSATSAASSANNAASSATAAATSESNASTFATNASASATSASQSAASASASLGSVSILYDSFDDRYLGSKSSDPVLDNDGNALLEGALYFNSTSNNMRVYNGSSWQLTAISSNNPVFTGDLTVEKSDPSGQALIVVHNTANVGDCDAVVRLDSSANGESVLEMFHDGTKVAAFDSYTDGEPDLNITTFGDANSVVDIQPNTTQVARFKNDLITLSTDTKIEYADDGGTAELLIHNTGTGDADSVLKLDSSDAGESVVEFYHDGTKVAAVDSFTDGNPDLNITTFGAGSVVDIQPNDSLVARFSSTGLDVTGAVEFDSLSGTGSVSVTDILDEDNMGSNSATSLATQQSIKAYVDNQVAGKDNTDEITEGSTNLYFTNARADARIAADTTLVHLTDSQTLTNKTLTSPDINGGTIDAAPIGSTSPSTGAFTTLTGVSATLTSADINGGTADNVVIGGSTPAAGNFTTISATSDVSLGDTDKILLGDSASERLEVYYDTNKAYLKNTGTGALRLLSSNWSVRNQADNKNQISTVDGGAVSLYYDGNVKLATTDTGASITGGLTTSGTITGQDLTLNDTNPTITIQDSEGTNTESRIRQVTGTLKLESRNGTGHGAIELETRNSSTTKTRFKIGTNGDSNFYNDSGVIGVKWDASSSRLGVGTSSPTQAIDVVGSIKTTTGIVFSDEGQSGATSTSNTLDGYEEGTYTPVYKAATTNPTYDTDSHTAGRYTKIGRVVHVVGRIRTDAGSSPNQGSGQLAVSLPFNVSDDTGTVDKQFGVLTAAESKAFLDNNFPSAGWASRGTERAYITKRNEAEQQTLTLNAESALDLTGDNKNDLVFTITYFTDD